MDQSSQLPNIPRQVTLTIGTTASEIMTDKGVGNRSLYILMNNSTAGQVITVSFGSDAIAGSLGIPLAVGQVMQDETTAFHVIWQGRMTAISSASGGTLTVLEWVENN